MAGERPRSATPGDPAWLLANACLLVAVALLLRFPLSQIGDAASINYNEGWNAYRQMQATTGVPLYGARPHLSVTNYPPLSFHVIGLLARFGLGVNLTGRLVALGSVLALAALAVMISRALDLPWRPAIFAGALFVAFLALLTSERVVANDPDLLGLALSAAGVLTYLRPPAGRGSLAESAALFALSLFTKHNLIGLPIAVGLHLIARRNWADLLVWCATGLTAATALLALTLALDGPFFLVHLLQPRAFRPHAVPAFILYYGLGFLPPLCLSLLWASRQVLASSRGLIVLALASTHLTALAFAFGDGVSFNVFFDALLVVSIAATASAFDRLRPGRDLALLACLLPVILFGYARLGDEAGEHRLRAEFDQHLPAIEVLLRTTTRPVICEDLLLCYQAGKPDAYDAYDVADQIRVGRLDAHAIAARVARREFGVIEIGTPDEREPVIDAPRQRFDAAFMHALTSNYYPTLTTAGYTILEPDPRATPP